MQERQQLNLVSSFVQQDYCLRLSAPLRHALIALCLYCVTGDEPSPDVLTRATRE